MRRRWWLLVRDVNNTVIYNEAFWTHWGADRQGRAVAPPLNCYYEVRRV